MCVWFDSGSDTQFVHVQLFPDMTERLSVRNFQCGTECSIYLGRR